MTLSAPGRATQAALFCDPRKRDLEPLEVRDGLVYLAMPGAIAPVQLPVWGATIISSGNPWMEPG